MIKLRQFSTVLLFIPISVIGLVNCTSTNQTGLSFNFPIVIPDSSVFGTYLWGRPLSGVTLQLSPDGTFKRSLFCYIRPTLNTIGVFQVTGDTLKMRNSFQLVDSMNIRDISDFLNDDPMDSSPYNMYLWRIDSFIFISNHSQNDSITQFIKTVLKQENDWIKMDNLPFRKINHYKN